MQVEEYKNVYLNEKAHFYYLSVHRLVLSLMKKHLLDRRVIADARLSILDAGCGTGGLAEQLKDVGLVTGLDMHDEAVRYSRLRGIDCHKGSICDMPFSDNEFDLVTSIDVICQRAVEDDVLALKEIARVAKPDGLVVLRVPARPELFSSHDELVMSQRRYRSGELRARLLSAGLEPVQITYCHLPFYLPVLVKTSLEKLRGHSPHSAVANINPLLNKIFCKLLQAETSLIKAGVCMPFGMGLFAIARKPSYWSRN